MDKLKSDKEQLAGGNPIPSMSILNSVVTWYDPRDGYQEPGYRRIPAVTMRDPLWTDDFSNILSVLR